MLSAIKDLVHGMKEWTIALVLEPGGGEFTQHALWALFGIAFAESSFFPIPPDIPFILMGVAKPLTAINLAVILTVGSVLGGALGYFIGLYGGRPAAEWLVAHRVFGKLFTQRHFDLVQNYYQKYDSWAVLIAAFTPIPYKVFTIGGGMCKIHFWRFMLFSLIGRAGRFFLVGTLLYYFGEQAQFLLKRMDLFLLGMLVLVILGFGAIGFLKKAPAPAGAGPAEEG